MTQRNGDMESTVGLLLVSAHGVRIAEWHAGRVDDLYRVEFGPEDGGERDLRGPAHGHPRGAAFSAPGVRSSRQHDLWARRELLHRQADIERVARCVAKVGCRERGWEAVLVSGDPRLAHAATAVFCQRRFPVRECPKIFDRVPAHRLATDLAPEVGKLLEQPPAARRAGR